MNPTGTIAHRKLADIATVTIAAWPVTVVALHIIQRDSYDPVNQAISELALGRFGMALNIAFVLFGCGLLALAVGLRREIHRSGIGATLLGVVGVLIVLSGVFPTTDPPDTTTAAIHVAVGVSAFLTVIVAIFVWAWLFRRDPTWRYFSRATVIWGVSTAAAFFLFPLLEATAFGIAQRAFIAAWLSWALVTARRLHRTRPIPSSLDHRTPARITSHRDAFRGESDRLPS